jgi:SH3 domain-containing YSC84-like protein 1
MKSHSRVSKWLLGTGVAIALLAPCGWAQNDQPAQDDQNNQPTTTSPGAATKHQEQKEEKEKDNTAKFDTKTKEGSTDIVKRLNNSASVLDEIMGTPDKGIPQDILADAKCIAVVPSMINIAVGIGGRHGKGVATCRTAHGWSAPAPITIAGGSWGLQIGGEATDLVMLVMNQRGMDHLLSSKFKIGAEASGAAGPVGRQVAGDTDWKMKAEVLSYSRSRGAFAGIDLNGASIKQDKDETALLYGGKFIPFETILSGKVAVPDGAGNFLATVRKYARESAEKQGE